MLTKKVVCLGDLTSHGGAVITATSSYTLHGRKAAVVGDLVSCPRYYDAEQTQPHGVNPIVTGDSTLTDEGRPLVVDGCVARCGCFVIAQQSGVSVG